MGGDEHHEHTEAVRAGLSEKVTSRQRGGRCGQSRGSQGGGGQGDSQELEFQPTFVSHLSQGDCFSGNGQERDLQAGHKVCTAVKNGKRCKAAAPSQLRPLDGGRRAVVGRGAAPCLPPTLLLSEEPGWQAHMSTAGECAQGCPGVQVGAGSSWSGTGPGLEPQGKLGVSPLDGRGH